MAAASRPIIFFLLSCLLLTPPAPQAEGLLWLGAVGRWGTLISLSHSLMERVANVRAERGDLSGVARARKIAHQFQLFGGGGIWSVSSDYLKNYAWRKGGGVGGASKAEIYRAVNELLEALGELGRMGSDVERTRWAARNYSKLVSAFNSILRRLSQAFSRSGPLGETVKILQREVAEGELLRDCLEVGARDMEGLLRIARDLVSFSNRADDNNNQDL